MRTFFDALAVWTQVPVASRLVEVNTKTGFSLTAGSYSVRASSTQFGSVTLAGVASNTATITSVTTTRAILDHGGIEAGTTAIDRALIRTTLTNATTVTATKATATDTCIHHFCVSEFF